MITVYDDIGIVLRTYYPEKAKIALLDKRRGRFDALVNGAHARHICNGALIRYTLGKQRLTTIAIIENVDQLYVPFNLASVDVALLHGLLELCLAYVPLGSTAHVLIDIFTTLYATPMPLGSSCIKKIIIMRMLLGLGLYPRYPHFTDEQMQVLALCDLDKITEHRLDLTIESKITEWIRACLQLYTSDTGSLSVLSLL